MKLKLSLRMAKPAVTYLCSLLFLGLITGAVQAQPAVAGEINADATVIYPADYFAQFSPVSANDMLSRIPGIGLATRRNRGGGGRGRGLGSGEGEILINGQRTTGKNNSAQSQLSRISADQVDRIEIIRGTSQDIDVRGGGQVVNVVLLESASRSSTAVEVSSDYLQDGTFDPGAKFSYSGQSGRINYLFHIEAEPRYNNTLNDEVSLNPDFSLNETRDEELVRDQTEFETSVNLGYQFDNSLVQLNALYAQSSPTFDIDRSINDFSGSTVSQALQREANRSDRDNWEVGGDYEYSFSNGGKYRFLFIVNDREFDFTRERFDLTADSEDLNLFLFNQGRDRERIARSSYTWNPSESQGLELGVERAQTIRDSDIRLGLQDPDGTPSADVGGLVAVSIDNASSTVEEIRYETFAIHNWTINPKMSLESSLIYETSTISQSGDVSRERDFAFVRPKVDFRYDISPNMQLRATIEKDVSQLSFSDFSATTDSSDEDQNTLAGNPEIVQEQNWRYGLNLEYRLPNDIGVLNSSFFYRDFENVIDRVDVSPNTTDLQSARGNIGDGTRYGVNLEASTRLSFLGLPNALVTTAFSVGDSSVTDPFLGTQRRLRRNNRWFGRSGFRHDIPKYSFNYGYDYFIGSNDGQGRRQIDINDIEERVEGPNLTAFIEKQAFGDITFRFETQNILDTQSCRIRTRFDGTTRNGIVEEIEDFCSVDGVKLALKIRTTF